jgi:hypothetical protein
MTTVSDTVEEAPLPEPKATHVARVVLAVFLLTFIASRVLVILIMSQRVPDMFLHMGGTHVHHLNYGIFLLSGVGGYLLFRRPSGHHLTVAAIIYAIGLALTFDEFGMWLHLGGSYWQRASFDAVVVVAAILGLIAYAPSLRGFRPRHWAWAILLAAVVAGFAVMLAMSVRHYAFRVAPTLHEMESTGPQ